MDSTNDWRLRDQQDYLFQKKLSHCNYKQLSPKSDHDHCEFCWKKFSLYDGDSHVGYCTSDKYYWICDECYTDFKEMFEWELVPCLD